MAIAVVGMLDEREEGLGLIRDTIVKKGHKAVLIDISMGTGAIKYSLKPDIGIEDLIKNEGMTPEVIKGMLVKERKMVTSIISDGLGEKLLELNEKTKHAEAIKSQFLSLIKNEFNNPISSLLNLSHSVVTGKHLDKIRSISEMMEMELLRLDFQLKNIFAATEIEAGETANHFSLVNFRTVFDDAMASFPYLVEEKKLQVTLESLSDLSQPPLQCL